MDITLCKGHGCILSLKCRRYMAKSSGEYQSYFTDSPYRVIDGETKCEMFWGEIQDSIINQLNEIVNGEDNSGGIENNGLNSTEKTE